jgi:catechol 2,3-dioxygenase-like lactoylglutathione lyase family enzyme
MPDPQPPAYEITLTHFIVSADGERSRRFFTEVRCYVRDPDGHLIEVGQTTLPGGWREFLHS